LYHVYTSTRIAIVHQLAGFVLAAWPRLLASCGFSRVDITANCSLQFESIDTLVDHIGPYIQATPDSHMLRRGRSFFGAAKPVNVNSALGASEEGMIFPRGE
jgi:hypothetical protein